MMIIGPSVIVFKLYRFKIPEPFAHSNHAAHSNQIIQLAYNNNAVQLVQPTAKRCTASLTRCDLHRSYVSHAMVTHIERLTLSNIMVGRQREVNGVTHLSVCQWMVSVLFQAVDHLSIILMASWIIVETPDVIGQCPQHCILGGSNDDGKRWHCNDGKHAC